MAKVNNNDNNIKILISQNRKASFSYELGDVYEGGLVLLGSEVKSLRVNKANISDTHIAPTNHDDHSALYIFNLHIPDYDKANIFKHYDKRPRKILLHRREINKLRGLSQIKGFSLIPLKIYFNHKNLVKVLFAVGKGKKEYDKREAVKQRDWQRAKSRILKQDMTEK